MTRTLETPVENAPSGPFGQDAKRSSGKDLVGVTVEEFEEMRSAAARVLIADGDADTSAVIESLWGLLEGASPDAAGKVSISRDTYKRVQGRHFMAMPHLER